MPRTRGTELSFLKRGRKRKKGKALLEKRGSEELTERKNGEGKSRVRLPQSRNIQAKKKKKKNSSQGGGEKGDSSLKLRKEREKKFSLRRKEVSVKKKKRNGNKDLKNRFVLPQKRKRTAMLELEKRCCSCRKKKEQKGRLLEKGRGSFLAGYKRGEKKNQDRRTPMVSFRGGKKKRSPNLNQGKNLIDS